MVKFRRHVIIHRLGQGRTRLTYTWPTILIDLEISHHSKVLFQNLRWIEQILHCRWAKFMPRCLFWKLWNVQTETFSVNSWWMKRQNMTCCQVDLAKWIHTSSHATCLGRFFDVAFVGCCIICKHLPDDHGFAKCTCCGWEAPTYASGGHWFIKLELQWTILNAGRRPKSLQWSARRLGGMV